MCLKSRYSGKRLWRLLISKQSMTSGNYGPGSVCTMDYVTKDVVTAP